MQTLESRRGIAETTPRRSELAANQDEEKDEDGIVELKKLELEISWHISTCMHRARTTRGSLILFANNKNTTY